MDRRTFQRRAVAAALALAGGAALLFARADEHAAAALGKTVILVRHAEKGEGTDPRDPPLSEAGTKRAAALARLLDPARPVKLFATEFQRTQQTLAPLAQAAGVTTSVMAAKELTALVAEIEAQPDGATIVVAGHSNTVPAIARALGAELANLESSKAGNVMRETEFNRLFVLHVPPKAAGLAPKVIELSYGD
jgi:phosphohistidine phosphatase SixA